MKLRYALAAVLVAMTSAPAQDADQNRPIKIGPAFSVNITRNIADYRVAGAERSWTPGTLLGVTAEIPIGERYAVVGTLGYYTLAFSDVNKAVDITPPGGVDRDDLLDNRVQGLRLTTEGSLNYLALTTLFRVTNFCMGFTFGLPLTAKITNKFNQPYNMPVTFGTAPQGEKYMLKEDISPPSAERNFLVEARIAGDFILFEHETFSAHFVVSGAYPLTEHIASSRGDDEVDPVTGARTKVTLFPRLENNFRLPTISLGVACLFAL
ncbi:MAG: hypothetical protein QHI48_04615 [Bacteroidota bacterium]|nr:hypothetical protein [Bacteroidota bacterium]